MLDPTGPDPNSPKGNPTGYPTSHVDQYIRKEQALAEVNTTTPPVTVASSGEGSGPPAGEQSNALLSKLGSSLFGATGSPQKVVTNIRGFLSNRLTSVSIPDTARPAITSGQADPYRRRETVKMK
uniref:Uncharacterized protein n=1 Tax=Anopheles farauti TaxID=69004 RepID=A0A182Q9J9_9DIPT